MTVCSWPICVIDLLFFSSAYVMKSLSPAHCLLLYIHIHTHTQASPCGARGRNPFIQRPHSRGTGSLRITLWAFFPTSSLASAARKTVVPTKLISFLDGFAHKSNTFFRRFSFMVNRDSCLKLKPVTNFHLNHRYIDITKPHSDIHHLLLPYLLSLPSRLLILPTPPRCIVWRMCGCVCVCVILVVQSARIAGCRENSIPLPSSEDSQQNQSNPNATISPINVAAHNILSLTKRDRTAQ